VLGTQETFCIVIAGLFERDSFDIFLSEFDKPWVIHLRETCCCSTNLCTWRPNIVYKDRSVRRHHEPPPISAGDSIWKSSPLVLDIMQLRGSLHHICSHTFFRTKRASILDTYWSCHIVFSVPPTSQT
jgi:hypothetical protein